MGCDTSAPLPWCVYLHGISHIMCATQHDAHRIIHITLLHNTLNINHHTPNQIPNLTPYSTFYTITHTILHILHQDPHHTPQHTLPGYLLVSISCTEGPHLDRSTLVRNLSIYGCIPTSRHWLWDNLPMYGKCMVWGDVMGCDVMWYDVMWCGVILCDIMRCDVMWCDVMWCDAVWCDVMWSDLIWSDLKWYDVI